MPCIYTRNVRRNIYVYMLTHMHRPILIMGWLRLVSSLKLHVCFAKYSLFCRALLQKRPTIWRQICAYACIVQPVPLKMRLGMVIGMQDEILIAIKKLPLYVSFQIFKWKETWNNSFMIPIRISVCIPMTISSLIFHGTGCVYVPCV